MRLHTFLCDQCDGYGTDPLHGAPHSPVEDGPDCSRCDGFGTVRMSYAEGDLLGLHPWTGRYGRMAEHQRNRRDFDPLPELARCRQRNPRSWAYHHAREAAMRPTLRQLRMVEAAIGCGVAAEEAVQAWRRELAA